MQQLVFATGNLHKFREVQHILPQYQWQSLREFPQLADFEPAETGKTLEENAALKARAYGTRISLPLIAEDTGLFVTALGGEPGIYAARWVPGTDQDRYQTLLTRLNGKTDRRAVFVAVACWYDPDSGEERLFRGEMPGSIGPEPRGNNGFGYDPVFIPDGYEETYAQLGDAVKLQLSHRAHAFRAFEEWYRSR